MADVISQVVFAPQRLTATIRAANVAAFNATKIDALARRHNKSKSGVRLKVHPDAKSADLLPTGLQGMFEQGRPEGYPIFPGGAEGVRKSRAGGTTNYVVREGRGTALALAGPFLSHPLWSAVGGKMDAYPAMQPAARDFATRGYQTTSRKVLTSQGFVPR